MVKGGFDSGVRWREKFFISFHALLSLPFEAEMVNMVLIENKKHTRFEPGLFAISFKGAG